MKIKKLNFIKTVLILTLSLTSVQILQNAEIAKAYKNDHRQNFEENSRFNFIILPKIISEKIETINKKGVDLRYFYPHTLDFVSQNSIQIY